MAITNKKPKSKLKTLLPIVIIILIIAGFCIWQNNSIVISEHIYISSEIPATFNNFKVLQVSDLHNKNFGKDQSSIMKKINKISPDTIVITGDLIDCRKYDLEVAIDFVSQAAAITTVYYVSGNHEANTGQYQEIKARLVQCGVIVLDNESATHWVGQDKIDIIGLADPAFSPSNYLDGTDFSDMKSCLSKYVNEDRFEILLSHRPELMDVYKQNNVDMVFSGHAHGGQFRIPFIGGFVAPGQGFFPTYDAGRFDKGGTTMFVSRGLGNSIIPIRIFNRPELVLVTLNTQG